MWEERKNRRTNMTGTFVELPMFRLWRSSLGRKISKEGWYEPF
jgi:hypothetical protein